MTKQRWNALVDGAAYLPDDRLPHIVCAWSVCALSEGHDGPCENLEPVSSMCGERAYRLGMGPCPLCPKLSEV